MSVFVKIFNTFSFGGSQAFVPVRELFFEIFFRLSLKFFHVFVDVAAEDSLSVFVCVINFFLFGSFGGTWESFSVMGDVDASIDGSL